MSDCIPGLKYPRSDLVYEKTLTCTQQSRRMITLAFNIYPIYIEVGM
jgi:hypothetical protein